MDSSSLLSTIFVALAVILLLISYRRIPPSSKALPTVDTLIPFVGSGIEFGWNIPAFLNRYTKEHGPDFIAYIGGRQFFFLSSPDALSTLYRNKCRTLQAHGVARGSMGGMKSDRVAEIVTGSLFPAIVKGNTESSLRELMSAFDRGVLQCLRDFSAAGQPVTLCQLTSNILFTAFTSAIWGTTFPTHIYDDMAALDRDAFYLFSQVTQLFAWSTRARQARVRAELARFMRPWNAAGEADADADVPGVSTHGNEFLRALVRAGLDEDDRAGLLLAYTWAMFSNVNHVTLWFYAHLLASPADYTRLRASLDADDADALLDSGLRECFRLHSTPISYRIASADVEFPGTRGGPFVAPKGSWVVANTSAVHYDGARFADPDVFRLDRFVRNPALAQSVLMYGRGGHMCLGRHMGDAMMKRLVAITLGHFDIEPEDGPGTFMFPSENPRSTGLNRAQEKTRVVLKARRTSGIAVRGLDCS